VSWWPQIAGGDAHAGTVETSLMLALRPELVVTDRLEMGNTESLAALAPQLRAGGVAAVSANGVLGDPRDATLSAGTSLLDKITVDLVATVEEAIRVDWPLPPR
jgi:creatinine amidohydrolase